MPLAKAKFCVSVDVSITCIGWYGSSSTTPVGAPWNTHITTSAIDLLLRKNVWRMDQTGVIHCMLHTRCVCVCLPIMTLGAYNLQ